MNNRVTINLNNISRVNKFVNEMSTFEADIDVISRLSNFDIQYTFYIKAIRQGLTKMRKNG